MPDNLPRRLQERLDNAAAEIDAAEAESSASRRWSLSDIDRLILEVSGKQAPAAPEPESEPEPMPEPEVQPEPEPEPEPEPAPSPLQLIEPDIIYVRPAPEPKPEAPSDTAKLPNLIRARDITARAPQQEDMRFDLFTDKHTPAATPAPKPAPAPKPVPAPAPKPAQEETKVVPGELIEKAGIVLKRVDMHMTSDLSPVPKVVPADELLRHEPRPKVQEPPALEDIPEGQQRFPDFDTEQPEQLREEDLERQLAHSREVRANQFRSLRDLSEKIERGGETGAPPAPPPPPEPPPGAATPTFEYSDVRHRDPVFHALRSARAKRSKTLGVMVAAALGSTLLQLLSMFFEKFRADSPFFLGTMACFLAAGLFMLPGDLACGARALFKRRPNADSILCLAALLCTAQTVMFFIPNMSAGSSAAPLFLCMAAAHAAARWAQARQRCDNFRFCAYTAADSLYALRLLEEDPVSARYVRRSTAEYKTVLPVPVRFPRGFVKESYRDSAVDRACVWLAPLALGLALVAGLSAGLLGESVPLGITAGTMAVCLCIPACGLLCLEGQLRALTKSKGDSGIAILNTDAADECAGARALVLDSDDLYIRGKGRMHGWREYWQVRTDDVLLYAAGIAIAAGGPLQAVFEGVVEGDYAVLPPVRSLSFEDRMGLTCQIHNQPVFFGNRKLLENHGVTVALTEKEEKAYEHDGRRILYLAMEKRLTAFFVVSYCPDPDLAEPLKRLEHDDVCALLCNSDPCVSAPALCEAFGLRDDGVTLLRAGPSETYRQQMRVPAKEERAGVYHANNARAFLRAVSACASLKSGLRRIRISQLVTSMTCCLLLLFCALGKQMEGASSLIFIAVSAVMGTISYTWSRG